jgi:hypothetical protein
MVATNQSWTNTEHVLMDQTLTPGVIKDFLDYFLSGYADWRETVMVPGLGACRIS